MPPGAEEPQRHVVVLDCNIYLDVAELLGPPFSWDRFDAVTARIARDLVPHPDDPAYDSLRAVASCTSGIFVASEPLEVWTNAHIDKMVRGKAIHPVTAAEDGHVGLGWDPEDAQGLVDEFVHGVVEDSGGGSLGESFPSGNPPLDHEDGMVYGACAQLAGEDPLAKIYCVTRDKEFLKAAMDRRLGNHAFVVTPSAFVQLIRTVRAQFSVRRMKPKGGPGTH